MKYKVKIIINTIYAILSKVAYIKDLIIDISEGASLIASYKKFNLAIILNLEIIFNTKVKIFIKIFNLKIRVLAIIIDILFFITFSKTLIIYYSFSISLIADINIIKRRYRLLEYL